MRHGPRRREAHPAADRLDETNGRGADLRLVLDVRQMDGWEPQGRRADPDGRRSDVALPEMTGPHDPAVLDLDERPQLVRFAKAVARPEQLEILQPIWRRLVAKSGVIDFGKWFNDSFGDRTPWGEQDSPAVVSAVESALERSLSSGIMSGGTKPTSAEITEGESLVRQG